MSDSLSILSGLYSTTEINVCTFKTLVFNADCTIYNHANLVSTYYVKKDGFLMFYTYTVGGVKKQVTEVKLFEYNVAESRLEFVSSSGAKFTCYSFSIKPLEEQKSVAAAIRKKIIQHGDLLPDRW